MRSFSPFLTKMCILHALRTASEYLHSQCTAAAGNIWRDRIPGKLPIEIHWNLLLECKHKNSHQIHLNVQGIMGNWNKGCNQLGQISTDSRSGHKLKSSVT